MLRGVFKMGENDLDVEHIREQLKYLIQVKNARQIIKIIAEMIVQKILPLEAIYDLIGELLGENLEYFMQKMYPKLIKKLGNLSSSLNLSELEKYILEKYSFFSGELLLTSFNGKVVQKDTQVNGRVYLTNYRIIAQGKFGPTPGSTMAAAGAGSSMGGQSGTNIGMAIGLNDYIQKRVQKQLQNVMAQSSLQNNPCFGYQYPIMDTYNVYRKKKNVKYRVNIEFEKHGKIKRKTLKMSIVPKKTFTESSNEFSNRRNENLATVLDNLK